MAYSPKLLCKHGLVYKTELLKSNTPLSSIQTLFQCIRCIFFNSLVMSPPKISDNRIQVLTNSFRDFEAREGVERYCLENRGY